MSLNIRSNAMADGNPLRQWMTVLVLGLVYIGLSSGLISFNKYLMSASRFPYAVTITMLQMGFSSCLSLLLYAVRPSLFPSLTDAAKKVNVDAKYVLKGTLPIAIFFSIQLVCTNQAYKFASVAFLQMLKEVNVVVVWGMSLACALEVFSAHKLCLIVLILGAMCMTIEGELNFSMTGLLVQASGQLFECSKIVMQTMLLSGPGKKLDALSYVMLVAPLCFLLLGSVCFAISVLHLNLLHLQAPQWSEIVAWWPHLLLNVCVAFALNVSIAMFVKHSSGVSFVLAGIAKDAAIVLAGIVFMHEQISGLQAFGFCMQLLLIWNWSLMSTFQTDFERGTQHGFFAVFNSAQAKLAPLWPEAYLKGGKDKGPDLETAPLVAKNI